MDQSLLEEGKTILFQGKSKRETLNEVDGYCYEYI